MQKGVVGPISTLEVSLIVFTDCAMLIDWNLCHGCLLVPLLSNSPSHSQCVKSVQLENWDWRIKVLWIKWNSRQYCVYIVMYARKLLRCSCLPIDWLWLRLQAADVYALSSSFFHPHMPFHPWPNEWLTKLPPSLSYVYVHASLFH